MSKVQPAVAEAVNSTSTGRAPKKKFPNATSAWNAVTKMIANQKTQEKTKAKILGLCDGNAPYSESELRRLGQAWRSNVNFREAESIIDNNSSAYWELMYDVSSLVIAKIPKYDQADKVDKQNIIADEFTTMITSWEGFFYEMAIKIDQMLKLGRGNLFWPDRNDWRFEAAKDGSLLLPKRSKCNIDKLNSCGLRATIEVSDAFDIADDPEGIYKTLGWKISNLRQVLVKQFEKKYEDSYTGNEYQVSDWLNAQTKIRNGDWDLEEKEFAPLKIVHVFTKEASTKVSHYILSEMDDGGGKVFLYDGFEEADHMKECVALFFYHFGDGFADGVKGLGHRIHPHVAVSNRLTNGLFDGAMLAGSVILEPQSGDAPKNITMARIGPVTILPAGHKAIQSSFQPPLNHMIAMRSLSERIMSKNSGIYDVPDPDEGRQTATENQNKTEKEARFSNNQTILFYLQWDRCLREMYRRVTRVAKGEYPTTSPGYSEATAFVNACVERGVSKEMLSKATISARRAVGLGSPTMRRQKIARVYSIKGALGDEGQYNITRDLVAAEVGYENADRYIPSIGADQSKDHDDWQILMEENDLHDGYAVLVTSYQNQNKHIRQHAQALAELLKVAQEQPQAIDPQATIKYLSVAINHLAEHMQVKAQDVMFKDMLKQLEPLLKEAQKLDANLRKAVQGMQQQQQAQQQAMAQQQASMTPEILKVQQKGIIDAQKADDMKESRLIKVEAGIADSQRRLDADIERMNRITDAKIEDIRRKSEAATATQQENI